ncbi:MAG: hypothetical protein M9933_08915 [Chitinophagaceae bacterium]|nr:hypothetical protein [Chitinophagaceae bacterium]
MRKNTNQTVKRSGIKRNHKFFRNFVIPVSCIMLFFNQSTVAQYQPFNETPEAAWFKHGFNGLLILLLFMTGYVIYMAIKALRERGQTLRFDLPIFRSMTRNKNTVSVLLFLIVVAGIIWTIKYKAG